MPIEPKVWGTEEILVDIPSIGFQLKRIITHDVLSIQVHPSLDHQPESGRSGKLECWKVISVSGDNPGIWLGIKPGVTKEMLLALFSSVKPGEQISIEELHKALVFKTVNPGEWIAVTPGTIHAIGAGLTILEPQWTQPGCLGITYRLYDWGRNRSLDSIFETVNNHVSF